MLVGLRIATFQKGFLAPLPLRSVARSATPSASYVYLPSTRMLTMKELIIKTTNGFVYIYDGIVIEVIV